MASKLINSSYKHIYILPFLSKITYKPSFKNNMIGIRNMMIAALIYSFYFGVLILGLMIKLQISEYRFRFNYQFLSEIFHPSLNKCLGISFSSQCVCQLLLGVFIKQLKTLNIGFLENTQEIDCIVCILSLFLKRLETQYFLMLVNCELGSIQGKLPPPLEMPCLPLMPV